MSDYGGAVFDQHAVKLAASAITAEVARERGYVSADTKAQLERYGFGPVQRRPPALIIPLHDVFGELAGHQVRPDDPRILDGKPARYESKLGQRMVLDVPRRARAHLGNPAVPLVITEGPLKADALVSAGVNALALLGVWAWKGTNDDGGKVALAAFDQIAWNDRPVYVCFDSDAMLKAGVHQAMERLASYLKLRGANVAYIYLPSTPTLDKVGVDDWLAAGGTPAELMALATAELRKPPGTDQPGEPVDTFDDVVDEPGWQVLDEVRGWLAAHVAYSSPHHAPTVALWCAHTHVLDRAASTPRIAFESPEPESGKSRNLELMECICHHGKLVLQMSPASVYRWVEALRPTILLDEVDAVFGPKASKDHEDLRALVNAGHRPGAMVPRVDKDTMRVVEFSCYSPVALAGLSGCLPDTIRSRSIRVPMRRRAPDETVRPFRERVTRPEGTALHRRLAAWASRHGEDMPEAPDLPAGVTDRQADQWEVLIAVADAAGGHWPDTARAACTAIVTEARANVEDQSLGIRLLADIHTVFDGADRMTTADLLAKLHALDDAPWDDWYGKPVTARWLASKLKPYGVKPDQHRFGEVAKKGYLAADFHEVWRRYDVMGNKGNKGNIRNTPGRSVSDVSDVSDTGGPTGNYDGPTGNYDVKGNKGNIRNAPTRDVSDVSDVSDTGGPTGNGRRPGSREHLEF
ncbi:MAG: DUF3631 domain-containing protein [Acidimicrobiales bacterium]